MTTYPILIEKWTGNQALTIICERCKAEAVIDADDILNEGLYECPADTELGRKASTGTRCRGSAVMKYEEADRCRGCGKLGFYGEVAALEGCCSRRCVLVAEHADSLKARP